MPHKCYECDRIIESESEHLLTGCPNCGNDSWELISDNSQSGGDNFTEQKVQQSARTDFVNEEYLESTRNHSDSRKQVETVKDADKVEQNLREDLSGQFNGISIARGGGTYEINLTELFRNSDTKYIIELDSDGKYTVREPSSTSS